MIWDFLRKEETDVKQGKPRQMLLYRLLAAVAAPVLRLLFRLRYEKQELTGPTLVICNHVTNYDPLLVGTCFRKHFMHFVASEHLFRLGWVSAVIRYITDPIPRRKGTSGADTAMACLRKLRGGSSVCLFAEGECTWDGVTAPIVPSTGRLAKMSNATLLTCRLEGGYLTAPRWGKGLRPGKMALKVVGRYAPEELKQLDGEQIEALIQRDIHYDTWESQKAEPMRFRSRRRAENLQTVLYLCPRCRRSGTLTGKGKMVSCTCGAKWEFTELGSFLPAEPFEHIAQWDAWQSRELGNRRDLVLCDNDVTVFRIEANHQQTVLEKGTLILENGVLRCGRFSWELANIDDLALVMSRNLLMSVGSDYYQLKAPKGSSLRKYRTAWNAERANTNCEV